MSDAPSSEVERGPSRWGERIISAILGIVVAVIAALIIGNFQAHDPHLSYSSTESVPFSGPNGDVSIYQVTLSNDGKREVYDVACAIRIPAAKIDQFKITADPLLNALGTINGDSLNVQIPNLNPSESIQVSLLASGSQNLPARPAVTVRGKGIVGSEKSKTADKPLPERFGLIATMAATLALGVSSVFARVLAHRSKGRSTSGDDQRQILAYICRMYGLTDLANGYSSQVHETTYWAEADRLGQAAVDVGGERMAAIENALLGLLEYKHMATSSKSIVYYNIALINHAKKDKTASDKYLELARNADSDEIETRLKIDPRFRSS